MKSIYFRYDEELISFCEIFFQTFHEIHVKWKRKTEWGNELQFTKQEKSIQQLLPIFVEVFICHRLDNMIYDIIKKEYLFSDDAEIEHICNLTKWLMADKRTARHFFAPEEDVEGFLSSMLVQYMRDGRSLHFDAWITFGMKSLKSRLVYAVGAGIDDMKREEEHQSFIQAARDYVESRPSKQSMLYIVQGDEFQFYKPSGKPYSALELRRLMQNRTLSSLGLDDREMNIAPVLTLLPEKIQLFGDDPEEPKTIALLSMFQERLQCLPLAAFPFSLHLN